MKTDKLTWNEALAAYDRDLEILESTRNEYSKFIEQTLEDAAALVAKRFKEPTEHS